MAVTYVTLYPPGGNSTQVQVVEGSQLHLIYAAMGFSATPSAPGPPVRPDPFPQYVHDDEIGDLLADAALPATDPVVAALVTNTGSATSGALRAAFGTPFPVSAPTGNDTAQIQAQLNAAEAAGGGTVILRSASYTATGLAIGSNVALVGTGGSTIKNPAAATGPVLLNKDRVNGNTNILIDGVRFDGNRENVASNQYYSTIDFLKVSRSTLRNVESRGGCRSTGGIGGRGEGLVMALCTHNKVEGGHFYENDYDGIKLLGSEHNTIVGATFANNHRSGVQLSFYKADGDYTVIDPATVSRYNTLTGLSVYHSSGVVERGGASYVSGIGLHGCEHNTITGLNVFGTTAGVDVLEGSHDNHISDFRLHIRAGAGGTAWHAGIYMWEYGSTYKVCSRNTFSDGEIYGISGNNGQPIQVVSAAETVISAVRLFRGGGTGTWNVFLNNTATDTLFRSLEINTGTGLSDSGVRTTSENPTGVTLPTGNFTVLPTHRHVLVTVPAGGSTVTLPASKAGRTVTIKKINSGTDVLTIAPASGTIDGVASKTITAQYDKLTVVCSGTNWWTV